MLCTSTLTIGSGNWRLVGVEREGDKDDIYVYIAHKIKYSFIEFAGKKPSVRNTVSCQKCLEYGEPTLHTYDLSNCLG